MGIETFHGQKITDFFQFQQIEYKTIYVRKSENKPIPLK